MRDLTLRLFFIRQLFPYQVMLNVPTMAYSLCKQLKKLGYP